MTARRLISLDDLDLTGKTVLVRVDFNVPLKDGEIQDDTRIRASLPTIHKVLDGGGRLLLMSHLGRPREGAVDPAWGLQPVADYLAELLQRPVPLVTDWADIERHDDDIIMLENVRFLKGEKADDETLSRNMAALCDIYVNDAFGAAHRAQASTHGVARFAPVACAGPLLLAEIDALTKAFDDPDRPMVAIIGGAKVSTKLVVLESLLQKVDRLIVGGAIANTFLYAAGYHIGKSLFEMELAEEARALLERYNRDQQRILIPDDVVCGNRFSEDADVVTRPVNAIEADELIMDIGPDTAARYSALLLEAATIIWNGPVGVYEFEAFRQGTRTLVQAVAESEGFSVAGGGDILAAISELGMLDRFSCVSTGGGAFLEFLEGKTLPAIQVLEEAAARCQSAPPAASGEALAAPRT